MKYIVFSLYGKLKKYTNNILKNANIIPIVYPGWKCRIYYKDTNIDVINKLKEKGWETIEIKEDYINERDTINWCMIWRFYPLSENNEYTIIRDADSIVNTKEKMAVDEWIESGKTLHLMHDHRAHDGCLILGGMFGLKGSLPFNIKDKYIEYCKKMDSTVRRSMDQLFLRDNVWDLYKDDYISHGNTPKCLKKFNLVSKEFPVGKYNFFYKNLYFIGQRNVT